MVLSAHHLVGRRLHAADATPTHVGREVRVDPDRRFVLMRADTIKVDLELNEESLAALERLAALGAGAVRVINPLPGDRLVFLMSRRMTMDMKAEFQRQAESHLECLCLVVEDVSEIIHLQAPEASLVP